MEYTRSHQQLWSKNPSGKVCNVQFLRLLDGDRDCIGYRLSSRREIQTGKDSPGKRKMNGSQKTFQLDTMCTAQRPRGRTVQEDTGSTEKQLPWRSNLQRTSCTAQHCLLSRSQEHMGDISLTTRLHAE